MPPSDRAAPTLKLNVGCGRDVKPSSEGWVNMDAFVEGPSIVKWDMTRSPWPFPDGKFALVYCSHVLEHVPFFTVESDGVRRDGLFAVMEEIHRVLAPGGVLHLKVPWGGSDADFVHPQHYRHWRPDWFSYFAPDFPENQYSSARFVVEDWRRNRLTVRAPHFLPLGKSRLGILRHLVIRVPPLKYVLGARTELEARLVAVK